ncbi:Uncharacterized protein dnm_027120 [Desulfonema magnum]|uniref:Uncharacterized protein n=1 Tax=Desulfonema magnum TaxID=45655 RepID=A0A975BKB1_9BACT|nr:Uncharacterized protein dnm_027120 [Desulfonema magnum]
MFSRSFCGCLVPFFFRAEIFRFSVSSGERHLSPPFYPKKLATKTQRHKGTTKRLRQTSCLRCRKNGRVPPFIRKN